MLRTIAHTVAENPTGTILPQSRTTAGKRALEELRAASTLDSAEGRLELREEKLGEGGMSVVRLGRQKSLDRDVAVKSARDQKSSTRAELELLQEAWVTGHLEHPNVVPVYDVAADEEGKPLIALKRIEGKAWRDLMASPEMLEETFGARDPLGWHLRVFMQVCNAVHYAHSRGVAHRDLKPENVMIGSFGEVYVLDWGIAVSLDEEAKRELGGPPEIAGTPVYMAPEMVLGRHVTEQTDVYLLGGCLHELLTGKAPHEGGSIIQIVHHVLHGKRDLSGLDPDLAAILERCLARKPDDRFLSAEAVRRAVQGWLEKRAAQQLLRDAQADLERLEEACASFEQGESSAAVYDLLGRCSFGFHAALRDHEVLAAAVGLRRARTLVIELELKRQRPAAAAGILAVMSDAPQALRERVERALADDEAELARLQRFAAEHDASVSRSSRFWATLILFTGFVVSPLVKWMLGVEASWTNSFVTPTIYLSACALVVILRRNELLKNRYNRRVSRMAIAIFAGELLFTAGQWHVGMDANLADIQDQALIGMAIALWSIFAEPMLLVAATSYFLAYLVGCWQPELAYGANAGSNLALATSLLWLWRPKRPPHERPDADRPDGASLGEGPPSTSSSAPPERS